MVRKKLSILSEVIFLAVFIVLLGGCRVETPKSPKSSDLQPKERGRQNSTKSEIIRQELKLTAEVQKKYYSPQEEIKTKVTLTNVGKQVVTVTFSSSKWFDLSVRNEQEEEIYRWSADKAFLQAIKQKPLEPNQNISRNLTFTLSQPARYKIVGETAKFAYDNKESLQIKTPPIEIMVKKP